MFLGIIACFLGIFLDNLLLYTIGLIMGQRVMNWKPIRKWAPTDTLNDLGDWYRKYKLVTIFTSRFMPNTHFPLYVTADIINKQSHKFVI